LCRRVGIPTPATRASSDPAKLARFAAKIGYPLYLKGCHYEAHLVHSPQELFYVFNRLMGTWGAPVLAQEMTLGEEYDVVGIGDGKGNVVGWSSIRKMLRTKTGKGFAGMVVSDPALDDLTRRIVGELRWNGPFELEFIKAAGQPHKLFEMNPRFPAWVGFPSQVGCNLPAQLLERILDVKHTPLSECVPGQMFIRHCIDLLGDISDVAQLASTGERVAAATSVESEVRP
jgi:carbamoyl-phosphate synthase large subunit